MSSEVMGKLREDAEKLKQYMEAERLREEANSQYGKFGGNLQVEPERQKDVPAEMSRLNAIITELDSYITGLEKLLEPLIRVEPMVKGNTDQVTPMENICSHADNLRAIGYDIGFMVERVRYLVDHLEI